MSLSSVSTCNGALPPTRARLSLSQASNRLLPTQLWLVIEGSVQEPTSLQRIGRRMNTEVARAYFEKASKRMKTWADERRRPDPFNVGDLVLDRSTSKVQPSTKGTQRTTTAIRRTDAHHRSRWKGLLQASVTALAPQHPPSLECQQSQALPRRSGGPRSKHFYTTIASRASQHAGMPKREVEQVLADRRVSSTLGKRPQIEYLVKWKNLPDAEASWERAETLLPFAEKIEEFLSEKATRTSAA